MTLEAHIIEALTTDDDLLEFFKDANGDPRPVEDWFFESGSLGVGEVPAVPTRPYMVWNELDDTEHAEVRETSDSRTRTFTWWAYDFLGSYDRINEILYRAKRVIKGLDSFITEDEIVCMGSLWLGTSNQIPNDGYDSSTKFGTSQHTVSR